MKPSLLSIKKIGLNKLLLVLLFGIALLVIAIPTEGKSKENKEEKQEEELIINMSSCGACAISNLQPY